MEKIIHYCWFGPKPLGKLEKKCLKSWEKFFPDYKIMKWSEENVDLEECEFIKEAYAQKKWAYVADYVRTKALYEYGGIYFDTDMEIIADMSEFIDKGLVLGLEDSTRPNGAVVIVDKKHNKYIKKLLDKYKKMKFNETGNLFDICIPKQLEWLLEPYGLELGSNEVQVLNKNIFIYPRDYFYPLSYDMQNNIFTKNTKTIHHFSASWTNTGEKIAVWLKRHKMAWAVKPAWTINYKYKRIKKRLLGKKNEKEINMYLKRIDKKNLANFLIPFCLFLFLLLVFSPGIITYDGNYQWQQIVTNEITNAHPFFSTYFMLLLSKIWNSPSVVLMFQVFIFSYFWMHICKIIRENNKKSFKKILIYTIIISFIPLISIYSITLWKDILYSYYLMFIIYYVYKGIKNKFKYTFHDSFNIGLLLALVFVYRHNGIIVSIMLLLMFSFIYIKRKIGIKKLAIILLTFMLFNCLVNIPKKHYLDKSTSNEEVKESTNAIDGYIIWMYGAHLTDDNINKKDLEKLNNVIPTDKWKKIYNPYLINSTSECEKNVEYYSENKEYFRTLFIETSLKKPLTIIEHYLKADSLLWSPIPLNGRYVYVFDYTKWWPDFEFNNGELYGYDGSEVKFPIIKRIVEKVTSYTLKFPIKIMNYPANALYASILLLYLLIKQNKNKKYWLLLIPCLFNTISLTPINLAQDLRYVYINYLTLLIVGLIFIVEYDFTKIKIFINKIVKKTGSMSSSVGGTKN